MTKSSTPSAATAEADCPMPSRITLPPPNLASSPGVVRSFSISMKSSVSARRTRSPVVGPYRSAYCRRGIFRLMRGPLKTVFRGAFQRGRLGGFVGEAVRQAVESIHAFGAADFDERHFLCLTGLESRRRAGGNIQPHAKGGGPVKMQCAVHFKKMKMRADLDGAVARISDFKFYFPAAFIGDHRAFGQQIFARNHLTPPSPSSADFGLRGLTSW